MNLRSSSPETRQDGPSRCLAALGIAVSSLLMTGCATSWEGVSVSKEKPQERAEQLLPPDVEILDGVILPFGKGTAVFGFREDKGAAVLAYVSGSNASTSHSVYVYTCLTTVVEDVFFSQKMDPVAYAKGNDVGLDSTAWYYPDALGYCDDDRFDRNEALGLLDILMEQYGGPYLRDLLER